MPADGFGYNLFRNAFERCRRVDAGFRIFRVFPGAGSLDAVVIASIMPLVPGVAITNAVFDTLHGDYLSGTARMLEAFVTAAAVAMGIGIGLGVG